MADPTEPGSGATSTKAGDDHLELFRQYRRTGDRKLRNQLVEQHLHLADPHVRRFEGRGMPRDDLRQVALIAVLGAVERFDPEYGVAFSTFAGRTIEGELKRLLRDRTWLVRPPRRHQEIFLDVRRAQDELEQKLRRSPTITEIAEVVGESEDRILEALEAGGARSGDSLDQPTPRGEPAHQGRLASQDAGYHDVEVNMIVRDLLDGLDEREREIIELRFFQDLGQPEIAELVGLSQSYVSRVIRRVLTSMRQELEAQADQVGEADPSGGPVELG